MPRTVPQWMKNISATTEKLTHDFNNPVGPGTIWEALESDFDFIRWAISKAQRLLVYDEASKTWTGSGKLPISREEFRRRRKEGYEAYRLAQRKAALVAIRELHEELGPLTKDNLPTYCEATGAKPATIIRRWGWFCEDTKTPNTFQASKRKRSA